MTLPQIFVYYLLETERCLELESKQRPADETREHTYHVCSYQLSYSLRTMQLAELSSRHLFCLK